MGNSMLHLPTKIFLLLIFLFFSVRILGQTHVLSGTIYDATTHEPLRNASIYNKTDNRGVRSDSSGRFTLSVGGGRTILVVSMVGYTARTISPLSPAKDSLAVGLQPEAQSMQQVVVTNNRGKYRNKDNPAVELIRKGIA